MYYLLTPRAAHERVGAKVSSARESNDGANRNSKTTRGVGITRWGTAEGNGSNSLSSSSKVAIVYIARDLAESVENQRESNQAKQSSHLTNKNK